MKEEREQENPRRRSEAETTKNSRREILAKKMRDWYWWFWVRWTRR
jgi:hypothetical protein